MRELRTNTGPRLLHIWVGGASYRSPGLALVACSILLMPVMSRGEEASAAAPTTTVAAVTSATPATYDASVRGEYDYRSLGDASDSELFGYWSAGGYNIENGLLDFYLSGMSHRNLSSAEERGTTFASLDDDAYRVFQGYLDVNDKPDDMQLRLGRQYIDVADYLTVDGAQAILFENGDLGGRVYVGAPVNYYSSDSEHIAFGASVVGKPWDGNRTRVT